MEFCQAREEYIRWLVTTRDLSPHTIRAYGGDIVAFERHLGISASLDRIATDALLSFIEAQQTAGLAAASIRRRASGLRGFCRWLHSSRLLEADPSPTVMLARARSRKLPRVVSTRDLELLLKSLREAAQVDERPDPNAPLSRPNEATTLLAIMLMVATGIRVNETATIRCHDIDIAARALRIAGKGGRERRVFLPNSWTVDLTSAYLATRGQLGVEHPFLLFNWCRRPLTPAAMRSRLVKAAQEAGLSAKVTPHMLRHTAATQLIEAGVDIRYIQRLLGHASLSTTEIYTHVSDQALRRAISEADVLGGILHHQ